MEAVEKFSVTPFHTGESSGAKWGLPFSLGDIRIDSVEGFLKAEYFSVWKDLFRGTRLSYSSTRKWPSFISFSPDTPWARTRRTRKICFRRYFFA